MAYTTLKVIQATEDTNALLTGMTHIWGVICHNSGTAASSVALHDALTVTGTALVLLEANSPDSTVFEIMYGAMWPMPVRFKTGVSVNVTNADVVDIYYS